MEDYPPESAAKSAIGGQLVSQRRLEVTLRENLDQRIKEAQERVIALETAKSRLEKSGILDMRIDDIHQAMRF